MGRALRVGGGLLLLLLLLGLLRYPAQALQAARDSLALCLQVVVPSLFPFFVLSSLLVELGLARAAGRILRPVMGPLFHTGGAGAAALALGLIGGYPVGARTAAELYRRGLCSRAETERLLGFCNNSGPAFFLGVIGATMGSRAGLLLYGVHVLAALLTGLLLRGRQPASPLLSSGVRRWETAHLSPAAAFTGAVTGALQSVLSVSAFVLFFGVAVRLLTVSGILPALAAGLAALSVPDALAEPLLAGLLEMTNGIAGLTAGPLPGRAAAAAFLMGWSGLSVHCQALALLRDTGLSFRRGVAGKAIHGLLSAGLTGLIFRFLPAPAMACLAPVSLSDGSPQPVFLSLAPALTACALFFLFSRGGKKRWKNTGRYDKMNQ